RSRSRHGAPEGMHVVLESGARHERRDHRLPSRTDHCEEEVLTVLEVTVDSAAGHAGTRGNFLPRRAIPAPFPNNLNCSPDQSRTGPFPFVPLWSAPPALRCCV